jgi:AcrR family transcriptional regulator
MTADERRAAVLAVALKVFGRDGISGASTEEIAAAAGISQPYLFRLFGTKRELFLETVALGCAAIIRSFSEASEGLEGAEALEAMGRSYPALIANHDLLLIQLQSYAASGEPEIRAFTSAQFASIVHYVAGRTGLGPAAMRGFFATGMLCNVVAALDLGGLEELWGDLRDNPGMKDLHGAFYARPDREQSPAD